MLRQIYAPLTDGTYYERADAIPQPDRTSVPAPIIVTSTKSAELIQARLERISCDERFLSSMRSRPSGESVGANVNQVVHGIGTDLLASARVS